MYAKIEYDTWSRCYFIQLMKDGKPVNADYLNGAYWHFEDHGRQKARELAEAWANGFYTARKM